MASFTSRVVVVVGVVAAAGVALYLVAVGVDVLPPGSPLPLMAGP